jgi:PAS domain-containing protein
VTDLGRLPNDDTDDRALLPRATDILESISEAFVLLDKGWRFRYVNAQAEALFERSRDELLGRCIWDAFPETVTSALYDSFLNAVEGAEPVTVSEFFPSLYRWLELRMLAKDQVARRGLRPALLQRGDLLAQRPSAAAAARTQPRGLARSAAATAFAVRTVPMPTSSIVAL